MAATMEVETVQSTSDDAEDFVWGNTCLPAILGTLGDADGEVRGVQLHFEYGMYATATFVYRDGTKRMHQLPLYGTECISAALDAPRGLQAITVDIEEGMFTMCECRYAPINARLANVIAVLATRDSKEAA